MKKLFENIEGNKFKLISESTDIDIPKSSLIRNGLKKVFSEGEKEYSYKRLETLGMGYIRNIQEAKRCALKEARELASEFGYTDEEDQQKFVKEDGTAEEKREVQIGKEILSALENMNVTSTSGGLAEDIRKLAQELIDMHSPNGPVVKPGTGPNALYKRGSIY